MPSNITKKIQRFLICKFCNLFRLIDLLISTALNIQPDDDCILDILHRKKESDKPDANKLAAINKSKRARCQIRVTKLDMFIYVILFEIYIGFRMVFAYPDYYPHFRWLFALLEHASNK